MSVFKNSNERIPSTLSEIICPAQQTFVYTLSPPRGLHISIRPDEKPITQRQKNLIFRLAGIKGLTTESLNQLIQDRFNKPLDNLNRVKASKLIQNMNG